MAIHDQVFLQYSHPSNVHIQMITRETTILAYTLQNMRFIERNGYKPRPAQLRGEIVMWAYPVCVCVYVCMYDSEIFAKRLYAIEANIRKA